MKTYMRLIMCAVLMLSFVGVAGMARAEEVAVAVPTAYETLKAAKAEIDPIIFEDAVLAGEMATAKAELDASLGLDRWVTPPADKLAQETGLEVFDRLKKVTLKLDEIIVMIPSKLLEEDPRVVALREAINNFYLVAERIVQHAVKEPPDLGIPGYRREIALDNFAQGKTFFVEGKPGEGVFKHENAWRTLKIQQSVRETLRGLYLYVLARPSIGHLDIDEMFLRLGPVISEIVAEGKIPPEWETQDRLAKETRLITERLIIDAFQRAQAIKEEPLVSAEDKVIAEYVDDAISCAVRGLAMAAIQGAKVDGVPLARIGKAESSMIAGDALHGGANYEGSIMRYLRAIGAL